MYIEDANLVIEHITYRSAIVQKRRPMAEDNS